MSVIAPKEHDTSVFPVGFNVFYFNQWKDFEATELHQFFTRLTKEEIFALKRGDIVWVDEEPYYSQGKVYGYTKRVVWSAEIILPSKRLCVSFGPTGFSTFSPQGEGKCITKVNNEEALKQMLEQLGKFAIALR